jgi:hypothetical protein
MIKDRSNANECPLARHSSDAENGHLRRSCALARRPLEGLRLPADARLDRGGNEATRGGTP